MSFIYNFISGINTHHPLNHTAPATKHNSWVLMCFDSPFLIDTPNGIIRGECGDFIINEPFRQMSHTNVPEAETGFINSWFHINGNGIREVIEKYGFEPDVIYHTVDHTVFMNNLIDLQNEIYSNQEYSDDMIMLLFTKLILNMSRQNIFYNKYEFSGDIWIGKLTSLREHMLENYTNQYTVCSLAKEVNISCEYFAVLYKKIFGISPMKDLNIKRMATARSLLVSTDLPVGEIAGMCGFNDRNYFSRLFKKFTGISPLSFRK